ncbi:MAG: hypothetical protein GY913_05530 [Proteobacteria bacterium]|nr:hypothetical protein [Pseudomonadota bacterium]
MSLMLLLACGGTSECFTHADCDESQACQGDVLAGEAECVTVECLDSNVCVHGEFCDPETYRCEEGCQQALDCPLQYGCVSGECVLQASCTDTQRDCAAGEYCEGGECVRDFLVCDNCGPSCIAPDYDCIQAYCYPSCSGQADCPAGFTCWRETCFNDCDWLNEYGYM